MPTDSNSYDEIARLAAARDEALRRYTEHLAAVQLKNSRWSALLSRHRPVIRSRALAATAAAVKAMPHAH
jgi:hypothetical protein